MKMMVKLAVLFATLLLLTGVSFADFCGCYEITATDVDNPEDSCTRSVNMCFDESGILIAPPSPPLTPKAMILTSFSGGLSPIIIGNGLTDWASFKFHGDWFNVITGQLSSYGKCMGSGCSGGIKNFCGVKQLRRYQLWGHKQENCSITSSSSEMVNALNQMNLMLNTVGTMLSEP
jgi:hypothetical protein